MLAVERPKPLNVSGLVPGKDPRKCHRKQSECQQKQEQVSTNPGDRDNDCRTRERGRREALLETPLAAVAQSYVPVGAQHEQDSLQHVPIALGRDDRVVLHVIVKVPQHQHEIPQRLIVSSGKQRHDLLVQRECRDSRIEIRLQRIGDSRPCVVWLVIKWLTCHRSSPMTTVKFSTWRT
jgi:hypothetical protein